MEPRDRAAQTLRGDGRRRTRLVAWSAVLVALAFAQAPGRVVTDTKLDLTVDPWGFLGRALTLWDPSGAFGQVQNQAYGYLFPMGPFFGLGDLAQLPPWVVQRAWWAVVLVVAFVGVVRLAEALGIGSDASRIVAALAFALSPRMLSVLGPSSIEVWPSAVAPWVILPLVLGARRGDPRRYAALSALAVGAVGGVNAVATFAVVPLAGWFLLVGASGPRRRALLLWWPPLVLAVTCWWILPLLLLGRYSPPFLDYIESAPTTTFAATVLDALRGTTNWVPYVDLWSDAGRLLVTDRLLILNGVLVLALGLVGLARRDVPHRRYLVTGLVLGLVAVTAGHVGATRGLGATDVQALLDGVLSPVRNTHKFDVLVRLPLVLGLAHLLGVRLARGSGAVRRTNAVGVAVLACAALAGATAPAWTGHVAPRGSYVDVPQYWTQTADWLADEAPGRALLLPATTFGEYAWGRTNDEPLQPLARSPWAVRNVIPLTPGGTIEWMDAVSAALESGRGDAGLAATLRRAGVRTFVVRFDVSRSGDVLSPEIVRSTLLSTPGVRRAAGFGPVIGGGPRLDGADGPGPFVDAGLQAPRQAVEVFVLDGVDPPRTATPTSRTGVLVGDARSLLRLEQRGAAPPTTVMAQDVAGDELDDAPVVLTDGNRRREADFAAVRDNRSASLTRQEPWRSDRPVHRYSQDAVEPWSTVPVLRGAKALTASSSRSDAGASPWTDPSASPWAAFDRDPTTAWTADPGRFDRKAWIDLDLGREVDLGIVPITAAGRDGEERRVRVTTQDGPRDVVLRDGRAVLVEVGRVSRLRISGATSAERPLALQEVGVPDAVGLARPLRLPLLPRGWAAPATVLLQADVGAADGCSVVEGVQNCSDRHVREVEDAGALDRIVPLRTAARYRPSMTVTGRGGQALDALVQRGRLATVEVSSQQGTSGRGGALALADGDRSTGWVAAADDPDPTVTLRWARPVRLDRVRLQTSVDLAATPVRSVRTVLADGTTRTVQVRDGVLRLPRVRTTSVELHLSPQAPRTDLDFTGTARALPVGLTELATPGVAGLPVRLDTIDVTVRCADGPTVVVDGTVRRTRLAVDARTLLSGQAVPVQLCSDDDVALTSGEHRVVAAGTTALRPADLLLQRQVATPDSATMVLAERSNTNAGWEATGPDGTALRPTVVDGWRQAWFVPAGAAAEVSTRFAPQSLYATGLGVGVLAFLAVVLLAALPSRPGPPARRRVEGASGETVVLGGWVLAAAWLAGGPGVLTALVAVGATWAVRRRVPAAALVGLLVAVAGGIAVLRPWGQFSTWSGDLAPPQLAALAAVSVVVAAGVRRPRFLSRRNGRSTSR